MKTLLSAFVAVLLPFSFASSADAATRDPVGEPSPSTAGAAKVVVTDPEGDVSGTAEERLIKATDVTEVQYTTEVNTTFSDQGRRTLLFVVKHGQSLLNGKAQHTAITKFTSGGKHYKAVYGGKRVALVVWRDGKWRTVHTVISGGAGGGRLEFTTPAQTFKSGSLSNMRTVLHLNQGGVKDATARAEESLRLTVAR